MDAQACQRQRDGNAGFQREPGLAATLPEQLIETIANRADSDAEISDQFGHDRHRDDVPGCEAWSMPLMRSQCRDGIPPSSQGIHRNGKQLANLALGVTHQAKLAGNDGQINTGLTP
jgi:hypothetical protein